MKALHRLGRAAAVLALLWASGAAGQDVNTLMGSGDEPVTIDAQEGIEWRQDEQVYIARGDAKVTRGKVSISADTLQAHYRKDASDQTQIWKVDALGHVVIISENEAVYGDKGTYNLDTGIFNLTGDNLRIVGQGQTVTARDRLEYHHKERIARALGNATARKDDKVLRADVLTAHFAEGTDGKLALAQVDATGGVVVTTPAEHASAQRASYDATKEMITLSGEVKLTRGDNQLNGEYAEVNLKTGVSRLLARPRGASGGAPVRGLFIPGSEGGGPLNLGLPGNDGAQPGAQQAPATQ